MAIFALVTAVLMIGIFLYTGDAKAGMVGIVALLIGGIGSE